MKILVTGVCGFVGSVLATELKQRLGNAEIVGLDNLSRPGAERNRQLLKKNGVRFVHGDIRTASDLETLPKVDWTIDAAANPSVLAGRVGQTSSRQLLEHNLQGTCNLLEFCKRQGCGLTLLSTSRVYSLQRLAVLNVVTTSQRFVPTADQSGAGLSLRGVSEEFSTEPPVSLYGAAKLASELIALEYGFAFDFPVQVNRCGVMAGAGQFGKPDQGIFSFWIHSYRQRRPLKYIGFKGTGYQVRDCLHPRDLAALLAVQIAKPQAGPRVVNVSGGLASACSLAELSAWCAERFGPHTVQSEPAVRPYDVPWLVLDSTRAATAWDWHPATDLGSILEEIAAHAERHPEWLEISSDL